MLSDRTILLGAGIVGAAFLISQSSERAEDTVTAESSVNECPECGEEMDRRGLHGHLRMAHNIDTQKASEMISTSSEETEVTNG